MGVSNFVAEEPILLLLLEKQRSLIPLNPIGLTVAQNSKSKLMSMYVGERLLNKKGELYIIRNIIVHGFYGNSCGRKLLSLFTGVYSINVELEKSVNPSLRELKSLLIRFLQYDYQSPDPMLPQGDSISKIGQRIEQAESMERLFSAFEMPKKEDCLDVL